MVLIDVDLSVFKDRGTGQNADMRGQRSCSGQIDVNDLLYLLCKSKIHVDKF